MEKRVEAALNLVENWDSVIRLNQILTSIADVIIGCQSIPFTGQKLGVISLAIERVSDVSALTGSVGKLGGVQV